MRVPSLGATLSISIDIRDPAAAGSATPAALLDAANRLIELLSASGLAATWAATDPASSDIIARARQSHVQHEAALLVDRRWLAESLKPLRQGGTSLKPNPPGVAGRSRFVSELVLRTTRARAEGLSIATLAIDEPAASLPLDLLAKHGIRALRVGGITGATDPTPLRFGIWQFSSNARLAGGGAFGDWLAGQRARRLIDRRSWDDSPLHLTIDAMALADGERSRRLKNLTSILRRIVRRQHEGLMEVRTIAQAVGDLSTPPTTRAASSILHAA